MTTGAGPDSPDITVRRCTVRVRRRDGWAWGDPEGYLDQVRAAIERALGEALAEAGIPADVDAVLTEPVTLTVGPGGVVPLAERRALSELLRTTVSGTGPAPVVPADGAAPPTPSGEAGAPDDVTPVGGARVDPARVAAALGAWSRAGRLTAVVSGWSRVTRAAWLRALHEAAAEAAGEGVDERTVARIAEAVLAPATPTADWEPDVRALVLVGAVVAASGDRPPDRRTLRSVLRLAGLDGVPDAGPSPPRLVTDEHTEREPSPAKEARAPVAATARSGPLVVPALPFLVVVQLGRLGYLEPAATALAVSGLGQPEAVLAGMLAGKVLAPPAHGWLRAPAERDAVRLVSGLDDEDLDAEVAAWEPAVADALAPLTSVLAGLYAADRSRFVEVVVTRAGEDGMVVGEQLGGLPIGWTDGPEGLAEVLAQLGDPPVVESDLFAGLVDVLTPRRALPGLDLHGLERHLGAAVGTGLGSLAQDLWGEDADALLALDRLGDLEARVEVTDRVTVGIPRGQRWLDLRRAGLIDAWPAPWAPDGLWELVTW